MLRILDAPQAVPDLQRYFATGRSSEQPPLFTGGRFEGLGGGGDRPVVKDVIVTDDLIAVQMLSVQVPAVVALDLCEGDLGREVTEQLRLLPTDIELGDDEAAVLIADDGPADRAWRLLKQCDGVGWVIAGKLLARKRPHLIPVYDDVVRCAYRTGKGFWSWLHDRLREQDGVIRHRLNKLRVDADLPESVAALRILDVVFWMRHRQQHRSRRCPGIGG